MGEGCEEGGLGKGRGQHFVPRKCCLLDSSFSRKVDKKPKNVRRDIPLNDEEKRKRLDIVKGNDIQHRKSDAYGIRKYSVARKLIFVQPVIVCDQ